MAKRMTACGEQLLERLSKEYRGDVMSLWLRSLCGKEVWWPIALLTLI